MSWGTERQRAGRRYFRVVEIDLDYCAEVYGVSPCVAVLGTTGDIKCFNTRATCQDPDNYNPADKTYRFCDPIEGIPRLFDAIPSLRGVEMSPAAIDPGRTLGKRASTTATFADHPHHDRGIDKYVDARPGGGAAADGSGYEPFETGTFFGKLRARNLHYNGRQLHVLTGFLPWDYSKAPDFQPEWTEAEVLANLRRRTYVMEKWEGPNASGVFKITGKDVLKLADNDRTLVPVPTSGRLSANVAAGAGAATLIPAGIGALEYAGAGTILIGKESITFTRIADALTLTARGVDGTTDADHLEDDAVQQAVRWTSTRVDSIIQDLLENYIGISSAFIPFSDWQDEAATWLSGHIFSTVIWKPIGVRKLLNELCEQSLLYLWWDEIDQEIKFRALRPTDVEVALTDDANVIEGSFNVRDRHEDRLTRIVILFALREAVVDVPSEEDFAESVTAADTDAESADEFGDVRSRKIFARWLGSGNRAQAVQLAARLLARYNLTPKRVHFRMGAKDSDLVTGDVFTLSGRLNQDATGAAEAERLQAIEVEELSNGQFEYTAIRDQFGFRYGYIGPDSLPDHGVATETQKTTYGWISQNDGLFADGTEAYRII